MQATLCKRKTFGIVFAQTPIELQSFVALLPTVLSWRQAIIDFAGVVSEHYSHLSKLKKLPLQ